MEGVQLRQKRGVKDGKVRRSYSCSDLSQLLDVEGGDSDGDSGDIAGTGEGVTGDIGEAGQGVTGDIGGATAEGVKKRGRIGLSPRGSTFLRFRRKSVGKKKGVERGEPVISAPIQPSNIPPTRKRANILPQHIKAMNFNNPFGTIGRRTKRRPHEGMPVVVLEKCFGPPPSTMLPSLTEHHVYPHLNPFATLPRNAARLLGFEKGGGSSVNDNVDSECNTQSANLESFLPSSHSPSHSPSRSPSPSPSPSHLSRAGLSVQKTGIISSNLTAPQYQQLLGKSMEKLPMQSGVDSDVGPFRTELGAESKESEASHAVLENPESETRWYFKYFLGKVHHNYLCYDSDKNPFFLSVVGCSGSIFRCILWRNTGCKRLSIRESSNGKMPSFKSLLEKFSVAKYDKNVKEVGTEKIQKDFLTMEEQEGSVNFKFGVLYAKSGQTTDNELYGNEHGSETLSSFLELLGDEVALQGWQHFRGGLDVKWNTTGATSVFTVFEGHEIMFHISTLLPFTTGNEQQLERKRHLGNDIVVIIFVDGKDPESAYQSCLTFDPSCMKSHFNHIFALVTFDRTKKAYRLVIHSAESVPVFGPSLPSGGVFCDHNAFRDFLLTKLINGEKASYCTPTFSEKRNRTLSLLLKDVEHKCTTEYRRALSVPVMRTQATTPNSSRKYAELEHSFTDYGQRLKVEKIITGHHPTSQRTTVSSKRDPWEPVSITEDFPFKITCGDYCDDGTLIVSTESDGTYFLYKDGSYTLMLDKTVAIGQVMVAHKHHLLLFRTAFTKENNYFYAIPLRHFYSDKIVLDSKASLSHYQIPCTKHCHLFCTAPLEGQFLRVAVASKTKVYMLAWKHPALSSSSGGVPLAPQVPTNPVESFIKHRELNLLDVPIMMTLLDERPSGKLCVSYQKQAVVDAVDEIKATMQRIPNLDIAKSKLICLSSVYCNGRSELLIGYNLTSQLITLHDGTAYNSAEVVWNSEPQDLVCMSPYVLAFMANTLEIRMASNGSLIQTINIPGLHLVTSKGDIYFTSTSLIHNYKGDSRIIIAPDVKVPKNIDKRGFLSSGRYSEPELPQTVYVYKICAEILVGRKDSNASTQSADEIFTRSVASDDSHSDTSLDHVHPILSESYPSTGASGSFTGTPSPGGHSNGSTASSGGGRRKVASSRKRGEVDRGSVSSLSEHAYGGHNTSILETASLESSMCSSPDSGVQDDLTNVGVRRTGSGTVMNSSSRRHKQQHQETGGLHFHPIPTYTTTDTTNSRS